MADLSDTIETAAGQPASAEGDGQKATARTLQELIEADRYLKGVSAASAGGVPRSGWGMLRQARYVPPGGRPC